jgi:cation transport regulator ChaC
VSDSIWIFGYGSLVWRPAFPYRERRPALVNGWARRFWQGSTDHRGVPGAPGRVVTLVADATLHCHGVAYAVTPDVRDEVLGGLDHRERGGYERRELDLHFDDRSMTRGLAYVATQRNPNYLGPAPVEALASQVARAHGPSGPNAEYVLRLAQALEEMGVDDAHVFELAAHVRALTRSSGEEPEPG